MIYKRHQPRRRRIDRAQPFLLGAQDFVVYRVNYNPFRAGTREAELYDGGFDLAERHFQERWRAIRERGGWTVNGVRHDPDYVGEKGGE